MELKKIEYKVIDRKQGVEDFDYFRDGRSTDLDYIATSFILMQLITQVNRLIELMQEQQAINQGITNFILAVDRKKLEKQLKQTRKTGI